MLSDSVTRRLVAIQNEQRSQKVATALNFGQLNIPDDTPTQTWSGNVPNATDPDYAAQWVAKFTRTDGINKPPLVDFPWNFDVDPTYYGDLLDADYLNSVTGRDKEGNDELDFKNGVYEVGPNYVSWQIWIAPQYWWRVSRNGSWVGLTVQAVSTVPGTLTLTKVK